MDTKPDFAAQDIADITQAARDYAEGWYSGDPERMRRALHPDLIKRTVARDPYRGQLDLRQPETNAEQMVRWTVEGAGTAWSGEKHFDVKVMDVFRDIAIVRCQSPEYVDYLHLVRCGDAGWRILNVLWQLREGDADPAQDAKDKWLYWNPDPE